MMRIYQRCHIILGLQQREKKKLPMRKNAIMWPTVYAQCTLPYTIIQPRIQKMSIRIPKGFLPFHLSAYRLHSVCCTATYNATNRTLASIIRGNFKVNSFTQREFNIFYCYICSFCVCVVGNAQNQMQATVCHRHSIQKCNNLK